ncbi:hypothetical protein IFR05_017609, partial [Cadophora sp. M221]
LLTAPLSHLTSFLILHELTAIIPLVGLATTFHYAGWLPEKWVQGCWVREGVERFGRWFGRKGLFGFGPAYAEPLSTGTDTDIGAGAGAGINTTSTHQGKDGGGGDPNTSTNTQTTAEQTQVEVEEYVQAKWHASEQGTRILVEVATAYAITKVLLPVRVLVSVWAAPWFARVVLGRFGGL